MNKYMIATTAIHKLGDISRPLSQEMDGENLCHINREEENDFIGNWVLGFGFIEVKFPKNTTRDLTTEEKAHYSKKYVQINSQPAFKLNMD